jgi:hypothetical protein
MNDQRNHCPADSDCDDESPNDNDPIHTSDSDCGDDTLTHTADSDCVGESPNDNDQCNQCSADSDCESPNDNDPIHTTAHSDWGGESPNDEDPIHTADIVCDEHYRKYDGTQQHARTMSCLYN